MFFFWNLIIIFEFLKVTNNGIGSIKLELYQADVKGT
jgi:hypothetical protein